MVGSASFFVCMSDNFVAQMAASFHFERGVRSNAVMYVVGDDVNVFLRQVVRHHVRAKVVA